MKTSPIIPTLFALDKEEFNKKLNILLPISKQIQLDIMDGLFVPTKSLPIDELPDFSSYDAEFEVHLMVNEPIKYIGPLKSKGIKKFIFHVEAMSGPDSTIELIEYIKEQYLKCFIAINPETPPSLIVPFLHMVDGVLVMGVVPGKEKQKFILKVYKSIEEIHEFKKKLIIEVDGGVTEDIAKKLSSIGVSFINSGSFISSSNNPKTAINKLLTSFNEGKKLS